MPMTYPHPTHRDRLLASLDHDGAAAVFFSGAEKTRNGDSTYRFRPESDFYYLTGFREPDAALVLLPRGEERAVLFLRPKDREAEIWTGRRLGVDAAPEALGVNAAHPFDELWERLPALLLGHTGVVHDLGVDEARDRGMNEALLRTGVHARSGAVVPEKWIQPRRHVHELRLRKSEAELATMRRAAAITTGAHRAAMAAAAPGKNECELDALFASTFRRHGGTGCAYTSIVAGGAGACILHYVENDRDLVAGELCLIDAGCEFDFYAADVTRTFPVDGTFTEPQRALYQVVLDAQVAAIEHARPGVTFRSVHDLAVRRLAEGLVELGLLAGPAERAIEEETYRAFYMHRTGHWLGLDVHDCGAYYHEEKSRVLEPGMVMTVEPGLYVAEDADVDARWRGIGIRIEDDVVLTTEGTEVLTSGAPKTVEEVEAACRGVELCSTP